jgi:hypothetical protein
MTEESAVNYWEVCKLSPLFSPYALRGDTQLEILQHRV